MYNPFSLENKTILVTGASSGIGRAIAIECSKMGATLLISGRNSDRLNETLLQLDQTKPNMALAGDLTDESFIGELVATIPAVDGVVFCAGVSDTTLIKFATKEKFLRVLDIDLLSQVSLIQNLLKKKVIKSGASLVFMASLGAHRLSLGLGLYSAAKSGLLSIMKGVAIELAPRKIRSNAILPSMVKTELISTLDSITPEDWAKDEERYPLGYGEPDDVALTAVYLLSDATKWMTGSEIVIDGGVSLV
jgi:NAD(P)-dependent dehydrogenase (short-subunit alcohol dehydrogenase family)